MNKCKRLSALLLVICLIVSMIVPTVYAEEPTTVTYNFKFQQICADNSLKPAGSNLAAGNASTKIIPQLKELHKQGLINWEYKGVNVLKSAEFLAATYDNYFHTRSTAGNWVAFEIDNPGCGRWKLSVEHLLTKYGAKDVNIYILPGTTKDLEGAMTAENVTQVITCYDGSVSGERPKAGAFTYTNTEFELEWTTGTKKSNPTYILAFEMATANESNMGASGATAGELAACLYLSSLTATLIEAGEEEVEEEEDEEIVLSDSFPIDGAIAYTDIVASVNALFCAVDTIDGVDYLYLFFDGNKMSVYNLDTGELYDRETNSFNTPRSVWIDEQTHVVWVTGSTRFLYKYDPATKTGTRIEIPETLFPEAGSFNAWGIKGDGQGNLYFATYNACYLGKYNINTGKFTQIGDILVADGIYSGNGGVILKDGYAYINIDGDKNNDGTKIHQVLKVDINTGAVVDSVDVSSKIGASNVYLSHMKLVGDVILCSANSTMAGCIAVDISGEKMALKEIAGMEAGFSGHVSCEIDGKVYFVGSGNKGLLAYDVATGEVTETGIANSGSLKFSDCLVTVAGNDKLPGQSLVTMNSATLGRVDVVFYNLTTKETVTLTDYTDGLGSGNSLRSMAVSEDGKTVYIGAYGNNQLAVYDVATNEVLKLIPTVNTQIEGMIWYDGYMYTGNYSSCSINKVDVATGERTLLVNLRNSTFWQYRIHATAVGDGNVYFGTAPSTGRLGGVLTWYDESEHRVYVAAGPNPEDVYWQDANDPNGQKWFNALTGEKAPFSGNADANITVDGKTVQRFTGVIKNQSINTMVYQDGYIIGSTTKSGGSGSVYVDNDNACIFVYDAKNWKLVARYDLADAISGLTGLIEWVDVVVADPEIPGKFWGVVSDTLFSFTFDAQAGTISVKTELSLGTTGYNHGSNTLQGRNILFDGDFMYVVFGSYGTYMVKRDDVSVRYKVSNAIPKQMVLAGDGNIYYHDSTPDLKVLRIAKAAQLVKDPYEIEAAKALINALDDAANITLDDEAAVLAARAAYDALSEDGKAAVDESKLVAAEAAVAPLRAAADKAAADAVIAQIDAIGEVTLEDEAAIVAARTAYDALTDAQKALVTNLQTLTEAEATLADLKVPPAEKAAAAAVTEKINAIGTVTLGSQSAIEEARAAYDALSDLAKTLVKNLDVLTAAETKYAELKAASEIIYNFDYKNLPLSTSSNSLYNKEKCLDLIEKYYGEGSMNWKVKETHYASSLASDVTFNGGGYFHGRAVEGDWVAFTLKAPSKGTWAVSQNYLAAYCGAEEVKVYILPADTADIAAAMTEETLIGTFNCYDPEYVTTNKDYPEKSVMKNAKLCNWTAGDASEYIVVYECAKANEDALANAAAREEADPENTRDYGANVYFAQLIFNVINPETIAVQEAIDAIGTVTLESEEAIEAARAAYEALTIDQQKLVDTTKLTAAEEALEKLIIKEITYNLDYKGLGLKTKSNSLYVESCYNYIHDYYHGTGIASKKEINWDFKDISFTNPSNTGAVFTTDGYFRGRSVVGDWVAFTVDSPGQGEWQICVNAIVTQYGASKVNVYLLPADTADVAMALQTAQPVGSYNCYDPSVGSDSPNGTNAKLIFNTTDFEDTWTAGDADTYILVFQAAEAEESSTSANIHFAQVIMTEVDADAAAVQARINAIGEVTLESEEAIIAARSAYDALNDAQKTQVTNLETLTAAESKLAELKAAEKEAADKAAADAVNAKIEAIGEVTLEDEAAIAEARTAYNALTDDQKALVSKLETLTAAESKLAELKAAAEKEAADKAAADAVNAKIEAIGDVGLDDEAAIAEVRAAYNALTDDQKKLVDEAKIAAAETALAALKKAAADKAAADAVNAMIDAIGEVTLESEAALKAASEAYNALTDDQKALVKEAELKTMILRYSELVAAAEKEAADKAAADAVSAKIEAIGTVTLDSKDAIADTRRAYDALTDDQKKLVDETALVAAEKAYEQLVKDATNPDTGDHTAVMLYALLAVLSVMAMAVLVIPCCKRRNTNG